ncbi:(2Fe-2S) ferredoxin domain-containing protein [Oculatella sp. FACHB-28]|uniref:(2Fe-2S) ferredoxin domain-containing protein n=1 Tax=Oculatella sp. FACHB-28 TaxID=2692845 RepID=UPI0016881B7C|nr:(2Fe-2S) ferredoxin domain-containing protein [Oculatella sp. FACHB-28]MBD2054751.1 (2Fe-2S) ferredoxin domain-containing protein [Oculatella sp. FACHB-28]
MSRTADFQVEGRFLGLILKDGYKPKAIRLATATGEYPIKLAKEIRFSLPKTLTPGEWIRVIGIQKLDYKEGTVKLKAYQVVPVAPSQAAIAIPPVQSAAPVSQSLTPAPSATASSKNPCILVCQKSDCCKRGGRAVSQALEQALSDRDLADQVTIKGTGCMKQCKAGPNIVMPDKTRYSRIRPQDIPDLVDKHFAAIAD